MSCTPLRFLELSADGVGPVGSLENLTQKAHAGPRCTSAELAAHSLPPAEGAEPGTWGQNGTVSKRRGRRRGPSGGFRGFRTAKRARVLPPAPSGSCAFPPPARSRRVPARALPIRPLAGPEGPGCPLQTTGHIRGSRFLSAVLTEGQLLA